jgi:hypothetical protein
MSFGYGLTLTLPATAISGRATRVHLAAALGASIVVACLGSFAVGPGVQGKKRAFGLAGTAAVFALLAGFGWLVQKDYRESWQYQRSFWTDVIALSEDARDGDVILVEPAGLPDRSPRFLFVPWRSSAPHGPREPRQIEDNGWALARGLEQILKFPPDWKSPPKVYRLWPDWSARLVVEEGRLRLGKAAQWFEKRDDRVEGQSVIFLDTGGGRLRRRTGTLAVGSVTLPLREAAHPSARFEKGHLYDHLVLRPNESRVEYLVKRPSSG